MELDLKMAQQAVQEVVVLVLEVAQAVHLELQDKDLLEEMLNDARD